MADKDEITLKMGDETIKIISNDERVFYLNKDVACVSKNLENQLLSNFKEGQSKEIEIDIEGDTVERLIEFLHFKFIKQQQKQFETPDNPVDEDFPIEPEEALNLLKAGIYLQC